MALIAKLPCLTFVHTITPVGVSLRRAFVSLERTLGPANVGASSGTRAPIEALRIPRRTFAQVTLIALSTIREALNEITVLRPRPDRKKRQTGSEQGQDGGPCRGSAEKPS